MYNKNVILALLFFIIIIATGCSNSQVIQSTTENESVSEIATDTMQNEIYVRKIADNVYLTYPDNAISHNVSIYNGVRVSCDYNRIKDIFTGNIEVETMPYMNKTAYNFVSDYNETAWFVEANSFYYYTENGSIMEIAGEELTGNESSRNSDLSFSSREKAQDEVIQSLKKLGIDADLRVHTISSIPKSAFEKYISIQLKELDSGNEKQSYKINMLKSIHLKDYYFITLESTADGLEILYNETLGDIDLGNNVPGGYAYVVFSEDGIEGIYTSLLVKKTTEIDDIEIKYESQSSAESLLAKKYSDIIMEFPLYINSAELIYTPITQSQDDFSNPNVILTPTWRFSSESKNLYFNALTGEEMTKY